MASMFSFFSKVSPSQAAELVHRSNLIFVKAILATIHRSNSIFVKAIEFLQPCIALELTLCLSRFAPSNLPLSLLRCRWRLPLLLLGSSLLSKA
eukprot:4395441-Amphidinium_carterae.1